MSFPETFMLCHSFCEVWRESCIGRKKKGWKFGEGEGRENKMNTFNTCKVKKNQNYKSYRGRTILLSFFEWKKQGNNYFFRKTKKGPYIHLMANSTYKAEKKVWCQLKQNSWCASAAYTNLSIMQLFCQASACLFLIQFWLVYIPLLKATLSITFHELMCCFYSVIRINTFSLSYVISIFWKYNKGDNCLEQRESLSQYVNYKSPSNGLITMH